MKKNLTAVLCAALIGTSALTGCQSTTDGGATGTNRKQLLLISSSELNQAVIEDYKKTLQEARNARALDVPAAQAARVKRIFNRLVPHTVAFRPDGTQFNWEIHTINSKTVNAWCMPGGKMAVYTGIIDQLKLTDDELAAIVGHEMAHALREHSREQLSQEYAKTQGLKLISKAAGLSDSQAKIADLVGKYGLTLPFSRTMESEADVVGLELMARAGYNPKAAATLWEKMNKLSGDGAFDALTSTHPTNQARIDQINKRVPDVLPLYNEARTKKAPAGKGKGKKR